MTMEGLPDRTELHKQRKEQEREWRRLRDRQRRQSMSLEEREKHLARRRKNYQLRRQRAENSRSEPQIQLAARSEMLTGNEQQDSIYSSDRIVQDMGAVSVESNQGLEMLSTEGTRSERLGAPPQLLQLPCRLRLSHLKHFARTINGSRCELAIDSNLIKTNLMTKDNGSANGVLSNALRFSHVKHLARVLHSGVKVADEKTPNQCKALGMELSQLVREVFQPKNGLMSTNYKQSSCRDQIQLGLCLFN